VREPLPPAAAIRFLFDLQEIAVDRPADAAKSTEHAEDGDAEGGGGGERLPH
jgi:hypothetical protein